MGFSGERRNPASLPGIFGFRSSFGVAASPVLGVELGSWKLRWEVDLGDLARWGDGIERFGSRASGEILDAFFLEGFDLACFGC